MLDLSLGCSARRCLSTIANFMWPPVCPLCHGDTATPHALCSSCWPDVTFITDPHCRTCGVPLPYDMPEGRGQSVLQCLGCLAAAPMFRQAYSLAVYDAVMAKMIVDFKNNPTSAMGPLFKTWIHQSLPRSSLFSGLLECYETKVSVNNDTTPLPTASSSLVVVPVPMHWRRLIWRSFNPAARLAHLVYTALKNSWVRQGRLPQGLSLELDFLVKHRSTPSQGKLTKAQRSRNVRGSFRVNPGWPQGLYQDEGTPKLMPTVLLVDDVWTTGATLRACCQALRNQGVRSIYIFTLARVL